MTAVREYLRGLVAPCRARLRAALRHAVSGRGDGRGDGTLPVRMIESGRSRALMRRPTRADGSSRPHRVRHGGTTAKLALVENAGRTRRRPSSYTRERAAGSGLPMNIQAIDLVEIAPAAAPSRARISASSPSAEARRPRRPVCYARRYCATVTDANSSSATESDYFAVAACASTWTRRRAIAARVAQPLGCRSRTRVGIHAS